VIQRIRISRVRPDLTTEQVFAFRIAGDQTVAEAIGHALQTRWMEAHPGVPTVMLLDWPNADELGDQVVFDKPPYFTWH
jgi:hypothetical protein